MSTNEEQSPFAIALGFVYLFLIVVFAVTLMVFFFAAGAAAFGLMFRAFRWAAGF